MLQSLKCQHFVRHKIHLAKIHTGLEMSFLGGLSNTNEDSFLNIQDFKTVKCFSGQNVRNIQQFTQKKGANLHTTASNTILLGELGKPFCMFYHLCNQWAFEFNFQPV